MWPWESGSSGWSTSAPTGSGEMNFQSRTISCQKNIFVANGWDWIGWVQGCGRGIGGEAGAAEGARC